MTVAAASVVLVLAAVPLLLILVNLALLRTPRRGEAELPPVSVLVPARDEEESIRACVEAARASEGVTLEIVVLDDHSTDATPAIVEEIARADDRVDDLVAPGHLRQERLDRTRRRVSRLGFAQSDHPRWTDGVDRWFCRITLGPPPPPGPEGPPRA